MQFDLITANPPWIPAEFVAESSPLDNGVFDPKEQFLSAAMNFASKCVWLIVRNPFEHEGWDAVDL